MQEPGALTIRPYGSEDLDAVIDIFLRAIRETASADYNPAQVAAWAQVDRGLWATRRLDRPSWVALVDRTLAGFTDLEADGHLDMLYVHPGHRGSGVAKRLVGTVEAAARAQGLSRVHTEASVTARPFFERQGFRVLEDERVQRNGEWFLRHRMAKDLDAA